MPYMTWTIEARYVYRLCGTCQPKHQDLRLVAFHVVGSSQHNLWCCAQERTCHLLPSTGPHSPPEMGRHLRGHSIWVHSHNLHASYPFQMWSSGICIQSVYEARLRDPLVNNGERLVCRGCGKLDLRLDLCDTSDAADLVYNPGPQAG